MEGSGSLKMLSTVQHNAAFSFLYWRNHFSKALHDDHIERPLVQNKKAKTRMLLQALFSTVSLPCSNP